MTGPEGALPRLRRALAGLRRFDPRKQRRELAARQRELARLSGLGRERPGSTTLLGSPIEIADGSAFVLQWRSIFEDSHYAFRPVHSAPRILDCGANIGLASIYWLRSIPDARITAFEPDPILAAMLRRNLSSCGASEVEVVEAAVWKSSGEVPFSREASDAGRVRIGASERLVNSVRLRDYLDEPIAMLKLDIEGAELDVLRDCEAQLAQVENLFVEYHSFADAPQQLDDLVGLLARAGFRLQVIAERASAQPFIRRDVYLGMDLQINFYAFRPGTANRPAQGSSGQ